MTVFTVHLPGPARSGTAMREPVLARAVFVPEKFCWGGLIFGPLWLIGRGLWLALLVWLVVVAALAVASSAGWLSANAAFWIFVLIALFLGFEGNNLRRRRLAWRGYRLVDVVAGWPQDMAERLFFARVLHESVPVPPLPAGRDIAAPADPHSDVLGHFPMPEDRG